MAFTVMACGCSAQGQRVLADKTTVPVCITHDCTEVSKNPPDLTGRRAKCCNTGIQPSGQELAFFVYCGPGSREATDICKCGYHRDAHDPEVMAARVPSNRKTVVELGKCKTGFVARGPLEFDRYYCGHAGWD